MPERRMRAIVHGQVQGVFFREHTRRQAYSLELRGWVRNRPDGTVETVFEGEPQAVSRMNSWLWLGSPMARVLRVESNDVEMGEPLPYGFEIRH
ncbi:MAG: hypothetical protein BWK76_24720 [Desulfobulbaceae bacterium A2]|nr:MAG: hypothetical protein BWK76_24720 [Desulfobulbaceae bacterium A2]